MPKIIHITNEGQSQDLNTGDSNASFLPLLLLHPDVSTMYLSHFKVYVSKGNAITNHSYKPGVLQREPQYEV